MARLTGIFEKFEDLNQTQVAQMSRFLKRPEQVKALENFAGNRILYPQTISATKSDLELDFILLSEIAKSNPGLFFNGVSRKIVLTAGFVNRFPPPSNLIIQLVLSIPLTGITTIFLKNSLGNQSVVGSIVNLKTFPGFDKLPKSNNALDVIVNGKVFKLNLGKIIILPDRQRHLRLKFNGLNEVFVSGGEIGLVLDLRI